MQMILISRSLWTMITEHYLAALNIEGVGEHCPKTLFYVAFRWFFGCTIKKIKKKKNLCIYNRVLVCG